MSREDLKLRFLNELSFSPVLAEKAANGTFPTAKTNEVYHTLKKCYDHFLELMNTGNAETVRNFFMSLKGDMGLKKLACIEAGVEEDILENRCCLYMLWPLVRHVSETYPDAVHLHHNQAIPATTGKLVRPQPKASSGELIDSLSKQVSRLNKAEKLALMMKILTDLI